MARNDITGDKLVSKKSTKDYRDNYEKIFYKKAGKVCTDAKSDIKISATPQDQDANIAAGFDLILVDN